MAKVNTEVHGRGVDLNPCGCQPDEHCKICDPEFFEKLKQEGKLNCKQCGKPFTLRLPSAIAKAMEEMRKQATEPVGTRPVCEIENSDPVIKLCAMRG